HITATTLERYLSDHRPILLCETSNDYGPIPFRFFHHWIQLEGFNNFVVNTWKTAPGDESNGMRNMMCKLKFIKLKIREWIKSNRHSRTGMKEKYKEEIRTLDDDIDNGNGSDTVVHKRME
nr:RNA-directed DNA polymerase, eukaryota [Tanacetum cinerariifolium]